MAKNSVHGQLAASSRDFKILLFTTDDGAPCTDFLYAMAFVYQVVLTAMQTELIRAADTTRIKAALNLSLEMSMEDKYRSEHAPELSTCLDFALKYARIVKPANLNKAIRTYEANPPATRIFSRPV